MDIRHELVADHSAISHLIKAAFDPMPFSDGDEAECLSALRKDGDLILSLVATDDDHIIGHIAFSPVLLNGLFTEWYGLGPVSVRPDLQRRGIGQALITKGLTEIQMGGALGCILIGNPAYYSRFGFVGDGRISYRNLSPQIVQWLAFQETKPEGVVKFSPGLEGSG